MSDDDTIIIHHHNNTEDNSSPPIATADYLAVLNHVNTSALPNQAAHDALATMIAAAS